MTTGRLAGSRRRAGFEFGPHPRDLTESDLGEGIAGLKRLLLICADPQFKVAFVEGEEERELTVEEIAQLQAFVMAEEARVDPENPPAPITELQTLGGSKPEAEGAAEPTDQGGEKAPDSTASDAADPARADEAAAASTEQAREQAGDAAADQKAASTEEHQPAETVPAPVAASDTPAEASKPAGEETASPAADAAETKKVKRAARS